MALSMTGFGRGYFANELFAFRIELRAVNHRYLGISLRLPRSLNQFEDRLRRLVGEHLNRGKIDISCFFEVQGATAASVRLDAGLAAGYQKALQELAALYEIPMQLTLGDLVRLPDLFIVQPGILDEEALFGGLAGALTDALRELGAMRRAEGDKLVADLMARLGLIAGYVQDIEAKAPSVPGVYRALLQKRLTEVLGQTGLDEARLAQEVALYADRCNITEELVRLRSHLGQMRKTLQSDGAVGRKADFIVQEINREINTIGAKANDLTISQTVIEVKTELEKIREQIQNLE